MPTLDETVVKTPEANRQYWFVKPDCGDYASIVSFAKTTDNSNLLFNTCEINSNALTDCDGNIYEPGKVIMATLSAGENETNESCKIVYTTSFGETDSFVFNVKIKERG